MWGHCHNRLVPRATLSVRERSGAPALEKGTWAQWGSPVIQPPMDALPSSLSQKTETDPEKLTCRNYHFFFFDFLFLKKLNMNSNTLWLNLSQAPTLGKHRPPSVKMSKWGNIWIYIKTAQEHKWRVLFWKMFMGGKRVTFCKMLNSGSQQ